MKSANFFLKSVLFLMLLSFGWKPVEAAFSVGDLIDGLNLVVKSNDSNSDLPEAEQRKLDKSLDYTAGFFCGMRSLARFEYLDKKALDLGRAAIDYDQVPKGLLAYIRSVLVFYQRLPFLRDEPAEDFLLMHFVSEYGASKEIKMRTLDILRNIVINAALYSADHPGRDTALSRWISAGVPENEMEKYEKDLGKEAFKKALERNN